MYGVFTGLLLLLILIVSGAPRADEKPADRAVAVKSADRLDAPPRISLDVRADQMVKVDISCSVVSSASPQSVGIRPLLINGKAEPLAPVQFASGGQMAVTGLYATGVWQAARDGALIFSIETTGSGDFTGCTLVGYRL